MTTIAWDGKILAADGMLTSGDEAQSRTWEKILELESGWIASAGNFDINRHLQQWIANGMQVPAPKIEGRAIFVPKKRGRAIMIYSELYDMRSRGEKMAIGSGDAYAVAAMAAGCNAISAVRIAIKFDTKSGGKVRWVRCRP